MEKNAIHRPLSLYSDEKKIKGKINLHGKICSGVFPNRNHGEHEFLYSELGVGCIMTIDALGEIESCKIHSKGRKLGIKVDFDTFIEFLESDQCEFCILHVEEFTEDWMYDLLFSDKDLSYYDNNLINTYRIIYLKGSEDK